MNAADTAARILTWAAGYHAGPAPRGDLAEPGGLADPTAELCDALARIAAVTAARVRCDTSPPLGLPGPVGTGTALLAATIGARIPAVELGPLLQAVPRPRSGWDHLARYGLIGAVQQATAELSEYDYRLPRLARLVRAANRRVRHPGTVRRYGVQPTGEGHPGHAGGPRRRHGSAGRALPDRRRRGLAREACSNAPGWTTLTSFLTSTRRR